MTDTTRATDIRGTGRSARNDQSTSGSAVNLPLRFDSQFQFEFEAARASDGQGLLRSVTPALAGAVPETTRRRHENERLLRQAGYLSRSAYVNFAALRYALTICSVPVLGVALLLAPASLEPVWLALLLTVPLVAWTVPMSIVERQARARNRQIALGVPDFMALMSLCLRQGLSVPAAFDRAAAGLRETWPALATEASLVGVQADVATFRDALRALSERIDVPQLRTLSSVLVQSGSLGNEVADALSSRSNELRELQEAEDRLEAGRLPRRMFVPTLVLLLPAALLVFCSPGIVEWLQSAFAAR